MADQGSSARRWSLDMPISITVEVGRARTTLGDLLALGPGAVLELNKPSHEPLDIFAGGALIARGETVVVGDHFGVRITEVVPAAPIAAADSNTETPA